MLHNYIGESDSITFSKTVNRLRQFFLAKGFVEVNTQDRLSILAACEDPNTVASYEYAGQKWPLPQTGQMWLEYELLTRPEVPGVFCVSTSYRNEPNPIPGRHRIIFPMFEFESRGGFDDLRQQCRDLVTYLGIAKADEIHHTQYDDMAAHYGVSELTSAHENRMHGDFGRAVFLENFPLTTSPFWNMKRNSPTHANKIDVIIDGMETFGTAERSTDVEEMRREFHTICGGGYAQKLYDLFGRERVEKELEEFLSLPLVSRYGGGIGLTRLNQALREREDAPVLVRLGQLAPAAA
jgi:aspartyl/asparaginyl-tRNA synthetase